MALGRVLALVLLCHGVIAGPLPGPQTLDARSTPRTRKLHGRFLHITGRELFPSGAWLGTELN
jgi:endopolyphosphatase